MAPPNLEDLERDAYQDSFSDGLIDVAVGLILAWIGIVWLWIDSLPGLAGVVSVVIAWGLIGIRSGFLEPRLGYVRWRAPRLNWERRHLILFTGLLLAAFLFGNGVMFAMREGDAFETQGIVPGLPAFVLGIGALVMAVKTPFKRLWVYGMVLVCAAAITVAVGANPGGSLLASGALICAVGGVLLTRFLDAHPVRETE